MNKPVTNKTRKAPRVATGNRLLNTVLAQSARDAKAAIKRAQTTAARVPDLHDLQPLLCGISGVAQAHVFEQRTDRKENLGEALLVLVRQLDRHLDAL